MARPCLIPTLEAICRSDAALFGAVTTPPNLPGYFSPVVRMRQALDLYANLRPNRSLPHPSSRQGVDLVIVRENTEGLYSGIERVEDDGNRAITERVITRRGSERIVRKAFEAGASDRADARPLVTKPTSCARPAACSAAWRWNVAAEPRYRNARNAGGYLRDGTIGAPEQFRSSSPPTCSAIF